MLMNPFNRWKITIFSCLLILALVILFMPDMGVAEAATRSTVGSSSTTTCGGWSIIPSPNAKTGISTLVSVSANSANDVWAVGYIDRVSGGFTESRTLTEHWNGTNWSIVPSPSPGPKFQISDSLNSVAAISTNDVWAVGGSNKNTEAFVEHWDGSQWKVVSTPPIPNATFPFLASVAAISANDIWAAGYYNNSAGTSFTLTEHWNGAQWSIVSSPNVGTHSSQLTGVAALSANDVWAVGWNGAGVTASTTLTEHWDGTQWSVVSSPTVGSANLDAVTAIATNDVWSVGVYSQNSKVYTLAEHWNGTQWSIVSSPNQPKISFNKLNAVSAVSTNTVWSVGEVGSLIERWNGTKWKLVSSPPISISNLNGVAVVPGTRTVWAVGTQKQNKDKSTLIEFYC